MKLAKPHALIGNFDVASVTTTSGKAPEELFSLTMEPEPLTMWRIREREWSSVATLREHYARRIEGTDSWAAIHVSFTGSVQ